jgi:hypothetical protein
MDAQFWIYIVIGVIYFLSRLLKKPEQASGDMPNGLPQETRRRAESQQPVGEAPRQLTFEELLREITEGKQAQRRVPEPEVIVAPRESYEKDLGDEARSLEEVEFNEAESARKWKPYEEVPVRSWERKSLEETMRLEDTVVDFRKFEAFQQRNQQKSLDSYIKIIRNPESLKQAVVMSEILKRKF